VRERALGRRTWGRNSTLFAVILNVFLSRNLDQIMLKNAYFLGKNCKSRLIVRAPPPNPRLPPAAGGGAPRLLRYYFRLLLQLYKVRFLC